MVTSVPLLRTIASVVGLGEAPRCDPARVLIPLLMPIGDTLFCQPALAGLRQRFPHARLTALVKPLLAPLIATNPAIDDVIVYDGAPDHDFITQLDETLQVIYARRFDMIVSFSPAGNCVAILTGIPRQVWQRLPYAFWLWGSALDTGYRARHAVDHYWNVVRQMGIVPQTSADYLPRWQVPSEDRQAARDHLGALGIDCDAPAPLVLLHPGAAGFGGRKRWPAENFGALARQMIAEQQAQVAILGGPEEVEMANSIVQATDGCAISLAGQTPLRESVAMIANCQTYVGCDSGLTHFACALGVPTVALFGVSSLAQFAPRPVCADHLRLLLPDPPRPPAGYFIGTESGLFAPHQPHDDRMASIPVDRVLAAIQALQQVTAGTL